jgi:hypothetical protein
MCLICKIVDLKRRIWNKRILLWWYRLWIRKDEFHQSLTIDPYALICMNEEEKLKYFDDLYRRRALAHKRSLE